MQIQKDADYIICRHFYYAIYFVLLCFILINNFFTYIPYIISEVCYTISSHDVEWFSLIHRLISARRCVPKNILDSAHETTAESYPMLNNAKLKTELSLVCKNDRFQACCNSSWRRTFRALSLRLSVFSTFSSPHPWQQQHQRDASLFWKECCGYALHGEETYQRLH